MQMNLQTPNNVRTRTPPPDVVFNGLFFAKLGSVDPVALDAKYHGFYRAAPSGVHLYTRSAHLEAYVVANERQGYFPVTASVRDDGRTWYMQSMCDSTERWLNLDSLGYAAVHDAARAMFNPKASAVQPA